MTGGAVRSAATAFLCALFLTAVLSGCGTDEATPDQANDDVAGPDGGANGGSGGGAGDDGADDGGSGGGGTGGGDTGEGGTDGGGTGGGGTGGGGTGEGGAGDGGAGDGGDADPPPAAGGAASSSYAPTTVGFSDGFDNGVPADADVHAGFWSSTGAVAEAAGLLEFAGGTAGGSIRTGVAPELNFFLQPLRLEAAGITFGSGATSSDQLTFSLSSTSQGFVESPDAVTVTVGGDHRLVLSEKSDAPGADVPDQRILVDHEAQQPITSIQLTLDQTSYLLEVSSGTGTSVFSGEHGLRRATWGAFGSSALNLGRRSPQAGGVRLAVDSIDVKSLKVLDVFANGEPGTTGYRPGFWKVTGDTSGAIEEASRALNVSSPAGDVNGVSSETSRQLNFLAGDLRLSGRFELPAAFGSGQQAVRFGLGSEQGTLEQSGAALAVTVNSANAVRMGWKVAAPGIAPESRNTRIDETLGFAPTTFELTLTRDNYDLLLAGEGGSRRFSGPHDIKWYDWSRTGGASLSLEAESSVDAGSQPPARWHFVTAESSQEPYVAPTVLGAFADGISLEVPDVDTEAQPLLRWGIVDVTRAPFAADPSGDTDSTAALQQAIRFARENYLVAFLPSGTYRVSDTLSCAQALARRSTGKLLNNREGPCYVLGSRAGSGRAKIELAPNSPGFDNPEKPKAVVDFWARSYNGDPWSRQPNISYNQMFVNVDVEIGAGNSGAIGIDLQGAQGSGIQESRIDATHGFAGIRGASGSGGSQADIEVVGGRYGLYLDTSQPAPTITGITLSGQTGSAIYYGGRQTLSAVGVHIEVPAGTVGPAIEARGRSAQLAQVALVDSVIDFAEARSDNVGFLTDSSVYLRNVYVRNAARLVETPGRTALTGRATGWNLVDEFARGIDPPPFNSSIGTFQFRAPVYLDGVRTTADLVDMGRAGEAPPVDLLQRHLWKDDFPGFESPSAVNVKEAPYSAAGDGSTDDTSALQRAIDENEIVFLPKGYYRTSSPLLLRPDTKLVGIGRTLSNLLADPTAAAFSNPDAPQPLVRTANDPQASTVLAFLQLRPQMDAPGAFALHWRSGPDSVVRAVNIDRTSEYGYGWVPGKVGNPAPMHSPLVLISANGGGKWYNFNQGQAAHQGPGYRHLLVDGTHLPLSFYQLNPEHAQGEANVEIRAASNVSIYGLKSESNYPALWVRDSDRISVYGYGGNAAALEAHESYPAGFAPYTPSLFRIERTTNLRLVNLVDQPRVTGGSPIFGEGKNPANWHMVLDVDANGTTALSVPLDRPVLYLRNDD